MKSIKPFILRPIVTFVALFTIITLSPMSFGQSHIDGTIQGKVIHASDQTPFAQVNIAIYALPDSTLTSGSASNDQGIFTVSKLSFGSYSITISYVGFQSITRTITLTVDAPLADLGTLALTESTTELAGVEVVTAKPGIIYQADKKIINVAQMKQAGATTLVEVLENAPGITTDTEGNVMLRGSSNYKLLIDGKPSPAGGANLLRQIPPDMVESIEIITNPSAKYEAEGAAGIINLILKKTKTAGFNSQATLMAGWNNKYSGDIQFGYRKNKLNLFGGISAMAIQTNANGFINRTMRDSITSIDRNAGLSQDVAVKSLNVNAGFDYDFNDKNSVTVSGRFGKMYNNVLVENRITLGVTDAPISQWTLYSNVLSLEGSFYNPQFSYRHKFNQEGHVLDFDLFTGGFNGDLIQLTHEYPSDSEWSQGGAYNTKNQSKTLLGINDTRGKIDYTKPFEKGKLEAGAQMTMYTDRSDFLYQDWSEASGDWVDNMNYTNDFLLTRSIYAGYAIWSGTIKKINYSLGMRTEYTDRTIDQETMGDKYEKSILSLFPSGSASLELEKGQSIQFSFSRRINRPAGMQLNPFPQYVDNQTIRVGNPEMDPEFIQSYEASYQKQTKLGLLTAQTYYRRVKDVSTFVMNLDDQNRLVLMPMNANRSHSMGLELTGNIQAATWLRLMGSSNFFYYILQDENMSDDVANTTFSWNARLNSIFFLGKTTRFTISANYTGPTVMLQGRMGGNFMLNLGLTQTMLKNQASLTLGVRDLLRTGRTRLWNSSENLEVYTNILPESPMVTLTFIYNMNNYQRRADEEQMNLNFIR